MTRAVRCKHGFLAGVVVCPDGCHGPIARVGMGGVGRKRRRSDSEIVKAIEASAGTLKEVAERLGYSTVKALAVRARGSRAVREALAKRRGENHPGFIDMTGHKKGGWSVIQRLPNARGSGNAKWLAQHTCGHTQSFEGIHLRATKAPKCKACGGPK